MVYLFKISNSIEEFGLPLEGYGQNECLNTVFAYRISSEPLKLLPPNLICQYGITRLSVMQNLFLFKGFHLVKFAGGLNHHVMFVGLASYELLNCLRFILCMLVHYYQTECKENGHVLTVYYICTHKVGVGGSCHAKRQTLLLLYLILLFHIL